MRAQTAYIQHVMEREPFPSLELGTSEAIAAKFLKQAEIRDTRRSLTHLEHIARRFSVFPYENLSKIIKWHRLDGRIDFRMPDEVFNDHSRWQFGGTCFSLTYYLLEILTLCGYSVQPVMGDMKWGKNVHCAVLVDLDNTSYLVDPGYLIHRPLSLSKDMNTRHLTPHSGIEIRFVPEKERFDLFTFRNGQFTWRYRFVPEPVSMDEFARHWIKSFTMPTMNGVCLTRTDGDEMTYIHNDFVKITRPDEVTRKRSYDISEKIILQKFGIPLEMLEEARYALRENLKRQTEVIAPDEASTA